LASSNAADAVDDILWASEARNERLRAFLARLRGRINDRLRPKEIECKYDFPIGDLDTVVPGAISQRLLYLANEILNNVLKHSEAQKLTAKLEIDHQQILLLISDDGCGFDVNAADGGRGLKNLANRTKDAGGQFDLSSRLGQGTDVRIIL